MSGRDELMVAARGLWARYVDADSLDACEEAFTGWGSEHNETVWEVVLTVRARRVRSLALEGGGDADDSAEASTEALAEYLSGIDELLAVRAGVRTFDEDLAEVGGMGLTEHAEAVQQGLAQLRPADGVAGSANAAALKTLDAYRGKQATLSGQVTEITPPSALGLGRSSAQVAALCETAGSAAKVDRIDPALLGLVQARIAHVLEVAEITAAPARSGADAVPRNAAINAALTLVLRAAGVPGIELSEGAELACAALAASGDIERTASIDARLSLLGGQLDRLERQAAITSARTIELEKAGRLTNLLGTFALGEQLRLIRVPPGAGAAEAVDVSSSAVLGLLSRIEAQARRERERRLATEGRPDPTVSRARREGSG